MRPRPFRLNLNRDHCLGVLLGLIAVTYGGAIGTIELDFWAESETVTARTLPSVLAAALAVIALVLTVRGFFVREMNDLSESRSEKKQPTGDGGVGEHTQASDTVSLSARLLRVFGLMGAMLMFAVLLPGLGFVVASATYLLVALLVMGERSPLSMGAIVLAVPATAWLILNVFLGVYLPVGTWFS